MRDSGRCYFWKKINLTMIKKAIILAGGFGTRLKEVVADQPKPMADINGKPFLEIIVQQLLKAGIEEIVFSLHYMPEKIINYFSKKSTLKNKFHFIVEPEPLGTGGAIKFILSKNIIRKNENFVVINGDTYIDYSLKELENTHLRNTKKITLLLKKINNTSRYGSIKFNDTEIISYNEKENTGSGFINAGVYVMREDIFNDYNFPLSFSLESDFLHKYVKDIKPSFLLTENFFIDIGVKSDYLKARKILLNF